MKRFLAFLCTLMLLVQPVGHVHAEDITTTSDLPQCEQCGGKAQLTQWADAEGGHVKACPHGVVDNASFQAHQYEWAMDETYHWTQCTVGQEIVGDRTAHYDLCTKPNVCNICGGDFTRSPDYVDQSINHSGNREWRGDGNEHWQWCNGCNNEIPNTRSAHTNACADNGVCAVCGVTVTDSIPVSHGEYALASNDAEHWYVCSVCQQEIPHTRSQHSASCAEPNKCAFCGAACSGDSISHMNTDYTYHHNETEHWQVCSACNQTVNRSKHIEVCTKPGKCAACGIDFVSGNMGHMGPSVLNTSATEHWYTCPSCKNEIPYSRRAHYGNAECSKQTHECVVCKTEYVPERLQHTYSEDTLKYNDEGHWYECPDCGAMLTSNGGINPHTASCTDLTHCSCGATFTPEPWQITHRYNSEYQSDETYHWKTCADCGVIIEHDVHWVDCTNPSVCWDCGATVTVEDWQIMHGDNEGYQSNETEHWLICPDCGEEVDRFEHEAICTAPGKCHYCGYEDPNIKIKGHDEYTTHFDADKHWFVCNNCGETIDEEEHYAMCDRPNKCVEGCGTKDEINIGSISHGYVAADYESDGTNHWFYCPNCCQTISEAHVPDPDDPNVCLYCGAKIAQAHTHDWVITETAATCTEDGSIVKTCACGETTTDVIPATGHAWAEPVVVAATCTTDGSSTVACKNCDEKTVEVISAAGHAWAEPVVVAATCTTNGSSTVACKNCDEKTVEVIPATGHAWAEAVVVAATCTTDGSSTIACKNCDEKTVEVLAAIGHDWAEPVVIAATCTKEGSSSSVCKNCDELSVSTIAPLGHQWAVTDRLEPTCTADGYTVSTCSVCAAESTTTLAATGHNYDVVVYVSQNNGTHGTNCLNGCGSKKTEKCDLVTTTIGNMLCSACAVCGYAEYTMQAASSELITNDVAAEIEIVRIENAVIAPVAAEEAPLPENTELVVHLTVPAVPIELDNQVQGKVEKLFAVNLISEGTSIQPSGKVRLSIPYDNEEEELDVNVMKLMLLCEDGTLMEIEYELIDGMIVFDTDLVGVFALMRTDELL